MKRLIILLLRKLLQLNKNQLFKFANQTNKSDSYYFTSDTLMKLYRNGYTRRANVSLSYLLSDECKIIKENSYV